MASSRCVLGDFIELCEIKNEDLAFGVKDIRGVNNVKQFMPTKVDVKGRDLTKFQIVYPEEFVFNHRTSRNGSKFSIALNTGNRPVICTEDYVVFRVKEDSKNRILPQWLYMFFNRPEFDRYVITNSWGSSTEFYNWEDICAVELELPPLSVQKKYVDLYNSLLANQKAYEEGLEDLKLCCDAYIERLRKTAQCKTIGQYIEESNERNSRKNNHVLGISKDGFINPKQNVGDLEKYKTFGYNSFVYSPPRINIGSIGLYKEDNDAVCSPIYVVFKVKDENIVNPDFLMMQFKRSEFLRATDFYSISSVRNNFSYDALCDMSFPIPDIKTQQSIANIYMVYCARKEINERLKEQLVSICPILIKGSLEEANK